MDAPTGIVTLVFTDLESSSELSLAHGAAFEAVRDVHFALLRQSAAVHNGWEIETAGDALFLAFARAEDAVHFAINAQRAMNAQAWPPEIGALRVRVGMHTGAPFIGVDNGRATYRGPETNRAARVQSAAHGGQILVSDATHDALSEKIRFLHCGFADCGVHRLKGIGEERLWQALHPDLQREFPPLNTLSPQKHNLPPSPGILIGRENEIAAWRALLCNGTRLLTLSGMGGLGKTRAALQVAELCIEHFAQGVWWVALDEARSTDDVWTHIADALRITRAPGTSIAEHISHYLRERHTLLVLDNLEQVEGAAPVVAQLLQVPRISVLATSRRELGLRLECVREVEPLPMRDAVRLWVERAQSHAATFALTDANRADVSELCRRLEGVPLALELAAARITMASPREIVRHLERRFQILQSRAPDLPPRQRALRGAIAWSYDLLQPAEQRVFAQLAVFAAGFFLEAAADICDDFDTMEIVAELRRHSLLRSHIEAQTQQTRFAMFDSVHEWARERLEEQPELAARTRARHAVFFARGADNWRRELRLRRNESATLAAFDADLDNVRAALSYVAQTDGATHGDDALLALALAVHGRLRGRTREALEYATTGLQLADGSPHQRADLLRECASLHLDLMELPQARRCAEAARDAFTCLEARSVCAEAWNLLGLIADREGDATAARAALQQALTLFESTRDSIGIAKACNNLGLIELNDFLSGGANRAAHHLAATSYLERALELHRRNADRRGLAESGVNLGVLAQESGDLNAAQQLYDDALACERELGFTLGIARVLFNLAEVAELRGEVERARRLACVSQMLFKRIDSPLDRHAAALCARLGTIETPPGEALEDLVDWALI